MNVFLDTSVLVAAVVQKHANHAQCFAVLDRVQSGKDAGFVSGHGLAEIYSVLTKSPPPFRHSPEQALLSIEENVVKHFKVVALAGSDYANLIREAALAGIYGRTIYDAVLLKCAMISGADKVFTLNVKHFQNIAAKDLGLEILAP